MPASAPIFLYTKVLAVPPLHHLRDAAIKRILPVTAPVGDAVLEINPEDAVISGSLAFGVYEPFETKIFRKTVKPGMTVVDIGANIGYYAVMAGMGTGPTGKVIAYEPDPTNMSFLQKNFKRNGINHAVTVQKAVSDRAGTATFYLTGNNKGTHSLVNNRGVAHSLTVETDTLDRSLRELGINKVDILKIDIEGAEPLALLGMTGTLTANPDLIIFTEFYPRAIRRLGNEPIDFLNKLHDLGFSIRIIDEDKKILVDLPSESFSKFISAFPCGERVKNLYLQRN